MAQAKRKDKARTVLKKGEGQRSNGTYYYRWQDRKGNRHYLYAKTLQELREQEKQIEKDKSDGIGKTLIAITNLPPRAMMGMEPEPPMPGEPVMLVATTQEAFMGAAVIQYPGFMEQAAEQIGGDFFVLPSSIHEVLLIPDDGKADFHELAAMVQSINETQVAPADRLSDNVYHYDKTDRVFELADKTADRKREQKLAKKAEQKGSVEKKSSVLAQLGEKKKEAMEHAPKAKAPGRAVPEAAL